MGLTPSNMAAEKSDGSQLEVIEPARSTARHLQSDYDIPTDLDDPHRAALEENPEHAEKLSLNTILAVLVSPILLCSMAVV